MIVIGITGGSGTGKSTVSDILRKKGVDVIDGDAVARRIVMPGCPALSEIEEKFGKEYIKKDGTLDRKKLGGYVFSAPDKLLLLNEITHKYISGYIDEYIKKTDKEIVGIDAAALIESGIAKKCAFLIGVIADKDERAKRIEKRDGISPGDAKKRISAQKNDDFYIENSDYLVYNSGKSIDEIEKETETILTDIRRKSWQKDEKIKEN